PRPPDTGKFPSVVKTNRSQHVRRNVLPSLNLCEYLGVSRAWHYTIVDAPFNFILQNTFSDFYCCEFKSLVNLAVCTIPLTNDEDVAGYGRSPVALCIHVIATVRLRIPQHTKRC